MEENCIKSAVIRVDASPILGLGHLMRCIALAGKLGTRGIESLFVMNRTYSDICGLVTEYGHKLFVLPSDTNVKSDYLSTIELIREMSAELVVTDICNSNTHRDISMLQEYHQRLASELFVVGIAGDVVFEMPVHVIVAPYVSSGFEDLAIREGQSILTGSDYVIIREEFKRVGSVDRLIRELGNRILITIGGTDEYHSTSLILEAIRWLDRADITLKVILAAGFSRELSHQVKCICADLPMIAQVISGAVNMADEMLWADIAITGDGITKYETAATGTPSIVISRPESNESFNLAFEREGSMKFVGQCTTLSIETLAHEIKNLIDNPEQRRIMSENGKLLVDCRGDERIVAHVLQRLHEN